MTMNLIDTATPPEAEHFVGLACIEDELPDLYAHYVDQPKSVCQQAILARTPITAMCGYTWVPFILLAPGSRAVCARCVEVHRANSQSY